jgi:hypothetical protein
MVEGMLAQLPTPDEISQVQAVPDASSLEKAEQFVLMLSHVSHLQARLECWNLMLNLDEMLEEVSKPLTALNSACKVLLDLAQFQLMLSATSSK